MYRRRHLLPAWIRLPLAAIALTILVSVQVLAFSSLPGPTSVDDEPVEVFDTRTAFEPHAASFATHHYEGAYDPETYVPPPPPDTSGIDTVWALAIGAVATLLGALLAIGFGMHALVEGARSATASEHASAPEGRRTPGSRRGTSAW